MQESQTHRNNKLIQAWLWWFTPRSSDPKISFSEKALRIILPIITLLRPLSIWNTYFRIQTPLPPPLSPSIVVTFFVVPIGISYFALYKRNFALASWAFMFFWFSTDLTSLASEGWWYSGFEISLLIQLTLASVLLTTQSIIPFWLIQISSVFFISQYLTGFWYAPPTSADNIPIANLNTTFLRLFFQEMFMVILLRFLRSEVDKRFIAQKTLIDELEERVTERTIELQNSNNELEAFSYSVSHDLRAPLRAIRGFSQVLLEDFADGLETEAIGYLKRIDVAAKRMNTLISEILTFSRIGRKKLERLWIEPEEIIHNVIADLQTSCDTSNVKFIIDPLPTHYVDSGLITQVYQNLLSNAVKFSHDRYPAIIQIGWQKTPHGGAYFIKDNGVGFDMEYVDQVFSAFQRLHRQEEFEGTGIGLATVQRILQKHDGKIWAEAKVGQGAIFYFTLGTP